jgi:hypothetical protein
MALLCFDIVDGAQSFMEMNVKPYGKNGWQCMLCEKKFSTENLMAVHFSRRHRKEAMGEGPS